MKSETQTGWIDPAANARAFAVARQMLADGRLASDVIDSLEVYGLSFFEAATVIREIKGGRLDA